MTLIIRMLLLLLTNFDACDLDDGGLGKKEKASTWSNDAGNCSQTNTK